MAWKLCLSAVLAATCIVSTSASAQSASVSINARVNTICTAQITGVPPARFDQGLNLIGEIVELCNNVDGYRLVVRHSEMSSGAYWTLDNKPINISELANTTVLVDSSIPAYRERQLGLYLTEPMSNADPLILYAEPKGVIF
ncbi:hypothetical protein [Qipengyuania qiaonensis]|uniref:Uncharacterized protein n=1 Tax=Qipengyuania qiaonensis TaxID=2867240 RepID=A0ABS7JEJ8_9SPHN|nr:hypothetical protein [Qipengyuania qiaonensis]MBX7483432.1 hypothetical protein [Qipengyuania qiaonensis]